MDMLRELASSQLPLRVVDTSQIDLIRVLDAAGCIVALIPPGRVDPDDCERQDPATVLEITAHGQKKLSRESTGGSAMDTAPQPEEMPTQEQHQGPFPEVLRYEGNQPEALNGIQRDLEIKVSSVGRAPIGRLTSAWPSTPGLLDLNLPSRIHLGRSMPEIKPTKRSPDLSHLVESDLASLARHLQCCKQSSGPAPRLRQAVETLRTLMASRIITSLCLGVVLVSSLSLVLSCSAMR